MTSIARDKDNQVLCTADKPLKSLDSGVFYIGELFYGTYYIKETSTDPDRVFIVTVNENGVGYTADNGKTLTKEVFAEK